MGGIGKTVIAAALTRDKAIQEAFSDGIFWLTFGERLGEVDIISRQMQLARSLSREQVVFTDVQQGKAYLGELLADKTCLLILDDVWHLPQVQALNVVADNGRSRIIVTTRDASLLISLGATEYLLDVLNENQAVQLLANWVGIVDATELPEVAQEVAVECEYLPLALALCGALVRSNTSWQQLLVALKDANLAFLDTYQVGERGIMASMKVSIDTLSSLQASLYGLLAVVPEDTPVPESALLVVWSYYLESVKGDEQPYTDLRQLITLLAQKALLRVAEQQLITLHDMQRRYLQRQATDMPALHRQWLEAYKAQCSPPADKTATYNWANGPDDGYFFQQLTFHLQGAGQQAELERLLSDFNWLQVKLNKTDANRLIADYDRLDLAERHDFLRLIQDSIRLSAHVIAEDKGQLAAQLLGRLLAFEDRKLQGLIHQAQAWQGATWLRPLTASLTPPGGPLIRTLIGHKGWVGDVVVTPNGRYILSASRDKTVKVWELETGLEIRTFSGHEGYVDSVTVTPDSHLALSGAYDRTVKVWEINSGRLIQTFSGHQDIVGDIAVTPDGRFALSCSWDKTVKVWEIESGMLVHTLSGHTDAVTGVIVTSDGRVALSCSWDKTVKVWEIESGTLVRTLRGHLDRVSDVTITPNDCYVLSASWDKTVMVWELESGKEVLSFSNHTDRVWSVAVTPDNCLALSAEDKLVRVWEIKTGQQLYTFGGHGDILDEVAVTPDGRLALTASHDETIKVWQLEGGEKAHPSSSPAHDDMISGLVVTPDDRFLISTSWDQTIKIWDITNRQKVRVFSTIHTDKIAAVTVTPNGRYGLSASWDTTVKVWEIESGKIIQILESHNDPVESVVVTPDGRFVLSASRDKTVKIWEFEGGKLLYTLDGHSDWVTDAIVTPDGRFVLSASRDKTVKIWEFESGRLLHTLNGHSEGIIRVAVTPDGCSVFSASWDGAVRVWEIGEDGSIAKSHESSTVIAHNNAVVDIVAAPNSRFVFSASWDKTVRAWEIGTWRQLAAFYADAYINACAIAHNEYTVIAGDSTGRLHFLTFEEISQR